MNFLAHAYLSGSDADLTLGNFLGDFVKGRDLSLFQPRVAMGIEFHRAIDEYTDHHPVVQESKQRLRPLHHHYAGVIVDIFYDHFLAANWSRFHEEPLAHYAQGIYRVFESRYEQLPPKARAMLPHMIRHDWLTSYADLEGVHRVLSGMSRRTPYHSNMERASEGLKANYPKFENEFFTFFPQLIDFGKTWLDNAF